MVLDKLAYALGRRDELPNIELAKFIAATEDREAIAVLMQTFSGKDKDIQSDSIKVLYEAGRLRPDLISPYIADFVALLKHKNNRIVWGAMSALDAAAAADPQVVADHLDVIMDAADQGSVITRDHAVGILIKLMKGREYATCYPLLVEQLLKCPVNQLPMYAENAMSAFWREQRDLFVQALTLRMPDVARESARKRLEKVIRKVSR